MTRRDEHHDAVQHSGAGGVIIVGADGEPVLADDEAHRLLGLPQDAERRRVSALGLDPEIAGLPVSGRIATDEVHLVGDRLLGGPPRRSFPCRDMQAGGRHVHGTCAGGRYPRDPCAGSDTCPRTGGRAGEGPGPVLCGGSRASDCGCQVCG